MLNFMVATKTDYMNDIFIDVDGIENEIGYYLKDKQLTDEFLYILKSKMNLTPIIFIDNAIENTNKHIESYKARSFDIVKSHSSFEILRFLKDSKRNGFSYSLLLHLFDLHLPIGFLQAVSIAEFGKSVNIQTNSISIKSYIYRG